MADNSYEDLKDNGNQKFKMKNYEEALVLYTQALSINESGLLAYTNRAMCLINLERYYEAKEDCDRAILLDPNFAKAYYRRAVANKGLYRLREAVADLREVIRLDPGSGIAEKELSGLCKQLEEDNRIVVKVTTKPAHLQSGRPVKCFQLLNQYSGTKQYE